MTKKILMYTTLPRRQGLLDDIVGGLRERGVVIDTASLNVPPYSWLNLLLLPLWTVVFLPSLALQRAAGCRTLICCGRPEKIIVTPLARLLGYRVFWFDIPQSEGRPYGRPSGKAADWPYTLMSRLAARAVFGAGDKAGQSVKSSHSTRVIALPPASRNRRSYQDELFRQLVRPQRNRFVVGSVMRELDRHQIERLLSALSIAMSVCPTVELVIIGDGEARRQLQWLIRKLKLEGHVWLAGGDRKSRAWFEHIDLYIAPQERPDLDEMSDMVFALANGIPVLAHHHSGLGDVITARIGGLVDIGDSESLARAIVKLQQEEAWRLELGANARTAAAELTLERLVDKLYTFIIS